MQCFLECRIPDYEFVIETEEKLKDDSYFSDCIYEILDELAYSILDNTDSEIEMPFSEENISSSIVRNALLCTEQFD